MNIQSFANANAASNPAGALATGRIAMGSECTGTLAAAGEAAGRIATGSDFAGALAGAGVGAGRAATASGWTGTLGAAPFGFWNMSDSTSSALDARRSAGARAFGAGTVP
jgi:hypothetical protein